MDTDRDETNFSVDDRIRVIFSAGGLETNPGSYPG